MQKTTLAALIVVLLSGLAGAAPFIIEETSLKTRTVDMNSSVTVVNDTTETNLSVGVNADPTMHFGRIPTGTNLTKYIQLEAEKKSEIELSSSGNISHVLEFDDRVFMEGNHTVKIHLRPEEAGYYAGEIRLRIQVPENGVALTYLKLKEGVEGLANSLNPAGA